MTKCALCGNERAADLEAFTDDDGHELFCCADYAACDRRVNVRAVS